MTGLICNKPDDPIFFLESAIKQIRTNQNLSFKWDSFIDFSEKPISVLPEKSDSFNNKQNNDSSENDNESIKTKKIKCKL